MNRVSHWILVLVCARVTAHAAIPWPRQAANDGEFSLRQTELALKQVDLSRAISKDALGYPKLNAAQIDRDNPRVIEQRHAAIILENRYLRLTLLPQMGRVYSLVSKITNHEQFWTNPIAKPLPGQNNDLGWWMVWGGVEYTIPRGEHGTTWALPWSYELVEDSRHRKAVRMTVLEPQTQLKQQLQINLYPDHAAYEAEISIKNVGPAPASFSHWINPMWAPGGRGELTAETELIVPCTNVLVADRDFNRWMLGNTIQPLDGNPLSRVKNWRSIGDLLANDLRFGFYSAFSHEANEGVVRVFDPTITPGVDIWTWGFPPPPDRQRAYSLVPNLGYVEMWGGTARDFADGSRIELKPGKQMHWKEWMFAYQGTGGLTYANQDAAVNFTCEPNQKTVRLALAVTKPRPGAVISIHSGREVFLRRKLDLIPEMPFQTEFSLEIISEPPRGLPRFVLKQGAHVLVETDAKLTKPLQWGRPFLSPAP